MFKIVVYMFISSRATEARRLGWYRLIESMYQNTSKEDDMARLQDFNVSSLSLEEMFLKLSHRKEDFIVKYGRVVLIYTVNIP